MCTIPRLLHTWEPGQLIDGLAVTRCAFGCMGPTAPTPATQAQQTHPPPRTVPYQPPSFNLDRPTRHLTKEERIEVHHNYISAFSNLEHQKVLINGLK